MSLTYPPLDLPKSVARDVWVVDSGPHAVGPLAFPVRMTVLRLADGGVWLHSPTRCVPALREALAVLGPVRHLVAPDTAHWAHLQEWQEACPEALVWAAPGVAVRSRAQGAAIRFDGELGATAPPEWAGQIAQARFDCFRFTEVAFFHLASRSLVLTDLVQHLDRAEMPFGMRLFTAVMGTSGRRPATPLFLRLLMRRPRWREGNRVAAAQCLAWLPERVLFSHGAWVERETVPTLRRALAWLL